MSEYLVSEEFGKDVARLGGNNGHTLHEIFEPFEI